MSVRERMAKILAERRGDAARLEAPALSLDDVIAMLRDRDAGLFVEDGALRYIGPEDAALSAGIDANRQMLTELFTYAPGGRCVFEDCYRLLGTGDRIACPDHRRQMEAL